MSILEGFGSRLILLPLLIVIITVHEFAHAFTASRLGDPTAKLSGRLTLNPLAHLDAIGTLALLFFGIGWGKPVPFNPANLKNVRRDQALIALAGPASNLAMALFLAAFNRVIGPVGLMGPILSILVALNLLLAIFNLLPFAPLDGFKVALGLLPRSLAYDFLETERYGIFILLILLLTGAFDSLILGPVEVITHLLGV